MLNPFDDQPTRLRAKVVLAYAILITANVAAWAWAAIAFIDRPALMGTAALAYMLGLRHALDADHIAAIDNVVRKLRQDGRLPHSAGFFFSLGHSTIVVIASVAVTLAAGTLRGNLDAIRDIGSVVGTSVSAAFLLIIGITNLVIFFGIWRSYSRFRQGADIAQEDFDRLLAGRGMIARFFGPMFHIVTRSWHMYPIGFLFGLGFDTATEVAMLGIAAAQAAQHMALWTVMVFPALFAAGMSLVDTTDSAVMTGAYGWAFITPARKFWYNLTVTAASVAVALFIGGIEALGLIGQRLGFEGLFWRLIGAINANLTQFGLGIVSLLIVTWLVTATIARARRYEKRQLGQG